MTTRPEDPRAVSPTRLDELRDRTEARISLGAVGSGIPTRAALRFNLDHARAREAVWTGMDAAALRTALGPAGEKRDRSALGGVRPGRVPETTRPWTHLVG